MPTPAFSLIPGQFQSLCDGFTHWAHPTLFFPFAVPTHRVQSDARYGFGNLPVLKVVLWRIAIIMQTFTELAAIRFSKTAQQNTAYPVHKI